jgi:hypothetical protein
LPWCIRCAMDRRDAAGLRAPRRSCQKHRRGAMRGCSRGVRRSTVAFVVLRAIGVYGEPNPWQAQTRAIAR